MTNSTSNLVKTIVANTIAMMRGHSTGIDLSVIKTDSAIDLACRPEPFRVISDDAAKNKSGFGSSLDTLCAMRYAAIDQRWGYSNNNQATATIYLSEDLDLSGKFLVANNVLIATNGHELRIDGIVCNYLLIIGGSGAVRTDNVCATVGAQLDGVHIDPLTDGGCIHFRANDLDSRGRAMFGGNVDVVAAFFSESSTQPIDVACDESVYEQFLVNTGYIDDLIIKMECAYTQQIATETANVNGTETVQTDTAIPATYTEPEEKNEVPAAEEPVKVVETDTTAVAQAVPVEADSVATTDDASVPADATDNTVVPAVKEPVALEPIRCHEISEDEAKEVKSILINIGADETHSLEDNIGYLANKFITTKHARIGAMVLVFQHGSDKAMYPLPSVCPQYFKYGKHELVAKRVDRNWYSDGYDAYIDAAMYAYDAWVASLAK